MIIKALWHKFKRANPAWQALAATVMLLALITLCVNFPNIVIPILIVGCLFFLIYMGILGARLP